MNKITWADMRQKMNKEDFEKAMPAVIVYEGIPIAVVAKPDTVIVLQDLHPRVQQMLRAQEAKARVGMPTIQRVYAEK